MIFFGSDRHSGSWIWNDRDCQIAVLRLSCLGWQWSYMLDSVLGSQIQEMITIHIIGSRH